MKVAGMLLTGGASRRLGADKCDLDVGDGPLAERTARLLRSVTDPTIEVGRGSSTLALVPDPEPGQGPLAAVAFGWTGLRRRSWAGAALVVATDLPFLSEALLRWLADHPSEGTVIPVDAGEPQPLCARYGSTDLDRASELYARGARSMRRLVEAIEPLLIQPEEWQVAAGHALALVDVDTPSDLDRVRGASALVYGDRNGAGPA